MRISAARGASIEKHHDSVDRVRHAESAQSVMIKVRMNTATFVIIFCLSIGAYFLGDFNTLYGVVPDGGNLINAWIKGLLLGGAAWVLINKLRDFITIHSTVKLLVIIAATSSGYLFEAGREQRVGRRILSKHFNEKSADGAWIHYSEKGNWGPEATLIEFSQAEMNPARDFPHYRKIPYCNIRFKGYEQLMNKIPKGTLAKASFYWTEEKNKSGSTYKVVGLLADNRNWFFQSSVEATQKDLTPEQIENARIYLSNGTYVDQSCTQDPLTYTKKLYGANKVIRSEWNEKDGGEKLNERLFDQNAQPLSGQLESEFVYFVEKEEAFDKGFGKAGMLRCVGYYTYKNGFKHGPYEFYYPGRVAKAFSGRYENGIQVGIQKQFNPNGSLKKSWGTEEATIIADDPISLSR
jgi:antitoxin component YwqK of YwqJK toxin-antitoxin module